MRGRIRRHANASADGGARPLTGQDRAEGAIRLLEEASDLMRKNDDRVWVVLVGCRLARTLAALGRVTETAYLLASGRQALQDLRSEASRSRCENEETAALVREELREAAFAEAREAGRKSSVDEAVAIALQELRADA
jgi:hypothetical protein